MNPIIATALFKGKTYLEYRKLLSDLLLEKKSTAAEQTEKLTHYSFLNEGRMKRLDKTLSLSKENTNKLKTLQKEYIWLVISEGWCGDAAQILPVFYKMELASDKKIDLKIVLPTSSIKANDRTPWFNINSSLSEDDPLRNSIKDANISA
jgi:hypothetical protein